MDAHLKIGIGLKNGLGVIDVCAGVKNRQRALAKQAVGAAGAGGAELLYFPLRERFQAALGADGRVDYLFCWHSVFLKRDKVEINTRCWLHSPRDAPHNANPTRMRIQLFQVSHCILSARGKT